MKLLDTKEAIYHYLTTDPELISLMGSVEAYSTFPGDIAKLPRITFTSINVTPDITDIWEITYQIDIWGEVDDLRVDQITERIAEIFNKRRLKVAGEIKVIWCVVTGQREIPEPDRKRNEVDIDCKIL